MLFVRNLPYVSTIYRVKGSVTPIIHKIVIKVTRTVRFVRLKVNLWWLAMISLATVSGLAVSGLLTASKTLSSSGSVKAINVEVYWDIEGTQTVDNIDWGLPGPGDMVNRSMFVKNSGNSPMNLSLTSTSWTPAEAETHLFLSWNEEGISIDPGEVVMVTLTLEVSEAVTGITDFSFTITIEGSG